MDIRCPRCGEPWDADELHEVAQERYGVDYYLEQPAHIGSLTRASNPAWKKEEYDSVYQEVSREFRLHGCRVLGVAPCQSNDSLPAQQASAAYELLGDDVDGAASFLEDIPTEEDSGE